MVNPWKLANITESAWNDLVRIGVRDGKVKIDDVADMYVSKIGSTPPYSVLQDLQGTIIQNMTLPGRLAAESSAVIKAGVSVGEKAGSVASSAVKGTVIPAIKAHPTISAAIGGLAAGGLLSTVLQKSNEGAVTKKPDPYAFDVPYDPNNVILNPGAVTKQQDTTLTGGETGTQQKDYGLVGNAIAWTGSTLFGQTGEDIGNFVNSLKPWVLGTGVIVGVVAVGYTISKIRGDRKTLRVETGGMARYRQ
jgi:hypothetical protein